MKCPTGDAVSRELPSDSKFASSRLKLPWLFTSTVPRLRILKSGCAQVVHVCSSSSFSRYLMAVLTTVAWLQVRGDTLIGSLVYGLTCSASTPLSRAWAAVHSRMGRASLSGAVVLARVM